jgi:hypothetical protein
MFGNKLRDEYIKELQEDVVKLRIGLQKLCKHEEFEPTRYVTVFLRYTYRKKCNICGYSDYMSASEYEEMIKEKELKEAKEIIAKYEPKKGVKRNAKASV